MKRIVVVGGAGFLGTNLIKLLLSEDAEIICVDSFISSKANNCDNVTTIKKDITKEKLDIENVDEIYHMASPASPKDYSKYPIETAMTNTVGTYNLLEFARKNDAKFLFASTSEVYGDPEVTPQPEEYIGRIDQTAPRACYTESKRFGETIVSIYQREYGLDTKIVRIFNAYGPGMRYNDGRVIPSFVWAALHQEDIVIYGDGEQTRSFCYVSDTVEGIREVMNSKYNRPINIGNPNEEKKIIELARMIIEMTNSDSRIRFVDAIKDEPRTRKPDITKAKKILGWKPKIDLKTGLERTIEYFENLKENNY